MNCDLGNVYIYISGLFILADVLPDSVSDVHYVNHLQAHVTIYTKKSTACDGNSLPRVMYC